MNRWIVIAAVAAGLALVAPSSATAELVVFGAFLDGPSEDPPVASPGTGFAQIDFDQSAHTMRVRAIFSGLLGTTTVAHIHAPTAVPFAGNIGVATQTPSFQGFPTGVTSGLYDRTFDTLATSTYNPSFITANGGTTAGAEAALFMALSNGRAYFNIHTTLFPPGEIRGFFRIVPEPSSALLAGVGLVCPLLWSVAVALGRFRRVRIAG